MNYRSAKGREDDSSLAIRHQCLDGPFTSIICLSSAARFSASSGDREHLPPRVVIFDMMCSVTTENHADSLKFNV